MRVLHLDTGMTMRGGQRQALLLIEALEAESILLAPPGSAALCAAQAAGINCKPLNWHTLRDASGHAEIVHCHDARAHTLAALWARAPFVVSRRVVFPIGRSVLSRWKYGRARHYLAISRSVEAELVAAGITGERITLVYDATRVPASPGRRDGPVVALASDDPRKGVEIVQKTCLNVRFSHDLDADLASASVFLYVTDSEGLGSAALYAMAHGVPVVASRVGGLPEIVRHEETGLLVDNDPQQIRVAVERLLDDPALAARLGMAGRRMVEARFSPERMAADTLAVYRKVLG